MIEKRGPRGETLSRVEIHHHDGWWPTLVFGSLFLTLAIFCASATWRVVKLEEKVEGLNLAKREARREAQVLRDELQSHASALEAHQEYIEAKQAGFATAHHYAKHGKEAP